MASAARVWERKEFYPAKWSGAAGKMNNKLQNNGAIEKK